MRFTKDTPLELRYRTMCKTKGKLYADTQYPIEAAMDKFILLKENKKLRSSMRELGVELYKEFRDERKDDREDPEWTLTKENKELIKYLIDEFQKELRIICE